MFTPRLLVRLGSALLLTVSARGLHAQGPPPRDSLARDSTGARLTLDSIAVRLERAEAALALLRQQLATESSTQVRLRSRVQLELSARLIVNGWRTTGVASNSEVPTFAAVARPADPQYGSTGVHTLGLSMRQSVVGASVSVDSVLGGVLFADLELDFFARALDPNPPLFPEPRLRTARAMLVWPRTEVMVGMETPLISDLTPITAAGVAIPTFTAAGNLWNWLPQVRVTRELWRRRAGTPVSIALQGAIMSPFSADRHVTDPAGPDAGQLSGRPALESRARLRWGIDEEVAGLQSVLSHGGEVGVGTHRGWLRAVGDTNLTSWAASADARVALGHGVEVRGEAYRGRLLRGLGGGAIGQNFGVLGNNVDKPGVPLTDAAGWVQLNVQWHPRVIAGVGCGTDRVLGASADRRRNSVCAVQAMWRPAQPLLLSFELRDLKTRYAAGLQHARHLNIGFGIEL
ncbi:hypothetical protein [Gemmatimonas groenlandica]|uniref:Uncharacterized protein n=1 Tax=Gemmatimonas groenlandica TaxID=2732249 RepID=A0A6M4IPB1_9BACT|nr:hypothetical protein [Gemmatimonas groenlandica]QJR35266.1 hypothetical protein HKW67_06995 [Gemmatimonas groenlandica]